MLGGAVLIIALIIVLILLFAGQDKQDYLDSRKDEAREQAETESRLSQTWRRDDA